LRLVICGIGKGINLVLKILDFEIETLNDLIFAFKLSFFLLEVVYLNIFSLNLAFNIRNLFILFLGDSLDDILSLFFKNVFNLGEASFDDVSHSAEFLKQGRNFLLQGCTEDTCDFRLHRPYDAFDFFLVIGILSYEDALEFHNSLNDDLELIDFGFLLIWKEVAVFKDFPDY
jgi:hypothetical protein